MNQIKDFVRNELDGWKAAEVLWLALASAVIVGLSVHWGDDPAGIIMALTGVVCVILTGKGKMSCYLFGLVNTVLYSYVAFGAKYYGEVMLNVLYYVPMQFVGWFAWKKHMDQETKEVVKRRMTAGGQVSAALLSVVLICGYGLVLKRLGGNLPFIDSTSTCLSVIAMIFSVRRLMEQWIVWIVVDVVTVFMWAVNYAQGQENVATLLMWSVYLLNAVFMLVKWFRGSEHV